jgi:hypothetical protein
MTHEELLILLAESGFDTGWVLAGEELTLWEHDADPPAPLKRPKAQDDLEN